VFEASESERVVVTVGMMVALRAVALDGDGEGVRSSTLREIKLLSQLRHPHVVRLLEIVKDKNCDLASNYASPSGPQHLQFLTLLLLCFDISGHASEKYPAAFRLFCLRQVNEVNGGDTVFV